VFDDFFEEEPFRVNIGDGHLIKGLDIAIMAMEVGETADVVIDPKYGYGSVGKAPFIPPNATLIYNIELLEV